MKILEDLIKNVLIYIIFENPQYIFNNISIAWEYFINILEKYNNDRTISSDATKINAEKSSNSEKEKRLMNFKSSFIYIYIILFENNFAFFFQSAKERLLKEIYL